MITGLKFSEFFIPSLNLCLYCKAFLNPWTTGTKVFVYFYANFKNQILEIQIVYQDYGEVFNKQG